MSEQHDSVTPQRARRSGQRLSAQERKQAQAVFLDSFKLNANVTAACQQAGISRETLYKWLEHDQPFSFRYHQAGEMANDVLLAAAWRRGVQGVEEPVVSMGTQVYVDGKPLMKRVYSDSVLLRLMSWRIPGFKEASGTTVNNVNMQVQRNEVYARLSEQELDQLESLWNAAEERKQLGH